MTDLTPKKLTLRDRKKAQPKAVVFLSDAERAVIRETVGKSLNDSQYKIFIYTCQALGLNPLLNEIACVTYKNRETGTVSMSIQPMRDGFLTIAHRSGKFAGLESGVYEKGQIKKFGDGTEATGMIGWARAYNDDFQVPVYQEADFEEYNTPTKGGKPTLWASKPKTMIKKVAEAMALRKAFNINGVQAPEEMDKVIALTAPEEAKSILKVSDVDKIMGAKDLKDLMAVCREMKKWANADENKAIVELYSKKKEEFEHDNS